MLDVPAVEQVIAVPKIFLDRIPSVLPFVVRRRQNSWWKCLQSQCTHLRWLPRNSFRGVSSVVFSQDRVQQRLGPSRSLPLQFLRVGGGWREVFKVLSQYRIQQRLRSRSLIFQLVEVFKIFAQARVPQLPHRVDCMTARMKEFTLFFALFPEGKKCGGTPPVECESARQSQLIRGELSSNGSGRGV